MSVWATAKAQGGRTYYYRASDKLTVWDRPADYDGPEPDAPPSAPQSVIDASWKPADSNGRTYYYNSITKETQWTAPAAYIEHQKKEQRDADRGPAFVAGGVGGGDDYPVHDRRMNRRDPDGGNNLPSKPSFDGGRGGAGMPWERGDRAGFRGPMPEKTDEPDYATLEQAEGAFFKLMKSRGVTPDMKWTDALRLVIREREYRALKDPRERQEAFEKYIEEARAQEKEKEKERKQRLKQDFREMLSTHEDIKHYTRWKTARPLIEREAVFKQAGNEDERRAMFDEYIMDLKKQHADEESRNRSKAMQELDNLMYVLVTDPDTKWSEAHEAITNSERFTSDDTFRALNKVNLLAAFDSHINTLNHVRNDAKQREKSMHARRERQARDAFRKLLNEHLSQGNIKAGTKWQDFLPLIEQDDRYTNILGKQGSSPLDLFWDAVEAEEHKLRSKRNLALDVLDDRQWEMTTATTLEEFADLLRSDPRTETFSAEEVQMVFQRLMEKVQRRAQDEKLHAERHQRKAIDALRSAIKHLDPPIRLGDTYEDVVPRMATLPEFKDLDDDEARRSAFEKHLRRLKDRESELERDRARRDRERDHRNGSRRERDDRDRRHRTRTPEVDAYEADRRKAQADRERQYRRPSFGLTPPPRERRDERWDDRRRRDDRESIYDRERRERELERERSYVSRADPRDKGRTLDYGDEDAVGSRPGSVRKRRESDTSARDNKRPRRSRTAEAEPMLKDEPPALQSGSEEGEIEEI